VILLIPFSVDCLRVLLEVDAGEFHAFQCERLKNSPAFHATMNDAYLRLFKLQYLHFIGDECFVSPIGRDVIHSLKW
jgi:hypothetical protein